METTRFIFAEEAKEHDAEGSERAPKDAIAMYFQGIRKYKLLTPKEELAFARKIKKGDKRAREVMITANLRLVANIARGYHRRVSHLKLGDLIDAGNEGLIRAVDRFKPELGYRFSTYATYWIRQGIDREIANYEHEVRNPVHVIDELAQYNKTVFLLVREFDRTPTISEIAAKMGKKEKWVEIRQKIFKNYVSLDAPIGGGDGSEKITALGNFIEGSDGTELYHFALRLKLKQKIADMFNGNDSPLDDREKEVLLLRYGIGSNDKEGLTLEEIGARFDLTRERVRQIETKAIGKLRKPQYIKLLRGLS